MASKPKAAEPRPAPRLYLVTPRLDDAATFADDLAATLGGVDVAAVLARLGEADERTLINRAKALATVVQKKDAALIIEGHTEIVARAGADGAHCRDFEEFTQALGALKPERIVGAGGLESRHDAMLAAESGADYVMFGEPDESGQRPSFDAIEERITWWAEVFEIPCVGHAESLDEVAPLVKAGADFIAIGDWLWREPRAAAQMLAAVGAQLRQPETAA